MKAVLVDDQEEAIGSLKTLLSLFCPDVEVIGTANGVAAGIKLIQELSPRLVFLDMEMPDGYGYEILERLPKRDFQTIFVTAHKDFAIQAIRLNALDYLMKPVNPEELVQAVKRVSEYDKKKFRPDYDHLIKGVKTNHFDKIGIPTSDGIRYVLLEKLEYLEASGNYTHVHIQGGEQILVSKTLRSFEKLLPDTIFSRVHQSYLVNLDKVKELHRNNGAELLLHQGHHIPVSRSKLKAVKTQLANRWKSV